MAAEPILQAGYRRMTKQIPHGGKYVWRRYKKLAQSNQISAWGLGLDLICMCIKHHALYQWTDKLLFCGSKKCLTLPVVENAAVVGIKLLWRGTAIRTFYIISRLLGLKLDRAAHLTPSIAILRPRQPHIWIWIWWACHLFRFIPLYILRTVQYF